MNIERASDWPLFTGLDVRQIGVWSTSFPSPERGSHGDEAVLDWLSDTPITACGSLALVGVSPPAIGFTRLGRRLAERDRCWSRLEANGVVLPEGRRIEMPTQGDAHRFVGVIDLAVTSLPAALRATEAGSCVCVGTDDGDIALVVDALLNGRDRQALLRSAVPKLPPSAALGLSTAGPGQQHPAIEIFSAS